jgi:metallo-beta-lactamase family protein
MDLFQSIPFDVQTSLSDTAAFSFYRAGHILGAASVLLELDGHRLLFSGDLGRADDLIMQAPNPRPVADTVLIESTYGDRIHGNRNARMGLKQLIESAAARGGTIIIPSFTVGRTQTLLHCLSDLKKDGWMSSLPVLLDSPMAIKVCEIYRDHAAELKISADALSQALSVADFVGDAHGSRTLDQSPFPKIILCASGMAVGGRVLHHLKSYIENPSNLVIFTGFQAPGTRGESLVNGAKTIRIHDQDFEVRAEIAQLDMLSAHADSAGLLDWLGHGPAPRQVCVTHGTPSAAATLAQSISGKLGYKTMLPLQGEIIDLAIAERRHA